MNTIIHTINQLKLENKLQPSTYKAWVSIDVLLYMKELRYDLSIHDKAFNKYLVTIHA